MNRYEIIYDDETMQGKVSNIKLFIREIVAKSILKSEDETELDTMKDAIDLLEELLLIDDDKTIKVIKHPMGSNYIEVL